MKRLRSNCRRDVSCSAPPAEPWIIMHGCAYMRPWATLAIRHERAFGCHRYRQACRSVHAAPDRQSSRRSATPPSARSRRRARSASSTRSSDQADAEVQHCPQPCRCLDRLPPPQPLREPQKGANVFSRPQTHRDLGRLSTQVKGSRFDSRRLCQTLRNSLTRKRSLVQIQYGPRCFCHRLGMLSGDHRDATAIIPTPPNVTAGECLAACTMHPAGQAGGHRCRPDHGLSHAGQAEHLALAPGYDTWSGSVVIVVETAGDDGDHVGLDVVHEPVLLGYPA
jgi:hypothetical protein